MKKTIYKLLAIILAVLSVFTTSIPAFAANTAITINSNYLFEPSTLDDLKLNLSELPSVEVSGLNDASYTIKDDNKLWWWQTAVNNRRIEFNSSVIGFDKKVSDLKLKITYENAGELNGKNIDLILTYSDFWSAPKTNNERYDTKTLWWTAYGTPEQQNSGNEWFMVGFEKFNLNIQFKYHNANDIFLNNAYFTLYSMDGTVENGLVTHAEAASAADKASQVYWYSERNMTYNSAWNNNKYTETDLYYGIKSHSAGNRDTKNAVCFQYNNRNDINLDMLVIGGKWSEGYHVNFTPLTAVIPKAPEKEISTSYITSGDNIQYTISQNLPKAYDDNFKLLNLKLSDKLNDSTEYISAQIVDESGNDVTDTAGLLTFTDNQTVNYEFNNDYLNSINYNGNQIKFIINAKAKNNISDAEISNTATTTLNNITTLSSNTVNATVYYPVTVNYIDENGNTLAQTINFNKNVGDNYTTNEEIIPNYELIAVPENATGKIIDSPITVNYIYRLKNSSVTINYIDESGKKLSDSEIITGKVFDDYNTQYKKIYGYELIATPENATGTMTEDSITVNYIYKLKNSSIIVNYIDEYGNKLLDSETITGKVFDDYTTSEKNIYGYKLTTVPINANGTMKEEQIIVNYVYTKLPSSVIANYVDENNNSITDSEIQTGNVNDSYSTKAKTIYGYELIAVPDNATGIMAEDTTIVNYIYKLKNSSVIVNYIDEDGNKLLDSETISGKVFDDYNTNKNDIDGYTLKAIPENANGTMTEEQIIVNYVYTKNPVPIATETTTEIKSPNTGNNFHITSTIAIILSTLCIFFLTRKRNKLKGADYHK